MHKALGRAGGRVGVEHRLIARVRQHGAQFSQRRQHGGLRLPGQVGRRAADALGQEEAGEGLFARHVAQKREQVHPQAAFLEHFDQRRCGEAAAIEPALRQRELVAAELCHKHR